MALSVTCFAIRKKYARVPQLSTEQLADWFAEGKNITLLDARPEEEYEVSRIAGAERVDPDNISEGLTRAEELIQDTPASQPIVLYCSIGYRSCMIADKLIVQWRSNPVENKRPIYNLEGSIFKWANENRPIVDRKGIPTNFVHPYSDIWGKLLDRSRRYSPQL